MLGDTGVAVHPDDERFRHLHGRHVAPAARRPPHPDRGRRAIPTPRRAPARSRSRPAHDFNDFEVGRRHALEAIAVLDELGRVNANAPEAYRGLDRFEARRRVVAELEALGLLDAGREAPPHRPARRPLGHAARAVPDRPVVLRRQDPGAGRHRRGRGRAHPLRAAPVGEHLLRVDAQHPALVHLAPALVGPPDPGLVRPGRPGVRRGERGRGRRRRPRPLRPCRAAAPRRGRARHLVLLGPVAVLDPGLARARRPSCARFYPTTVLVTGFDIIFFWVARMMMLGLHFMGEVPFKDVYIHGLVRDERGAKMSKTKGNVVDPLQLIDDYGADALRLALLASTAQGRDVKFGPARVEGYRNFVTKLWNAARFVADERGARCDPGFDPAACRAAAQPLDRRRDRRRPPPPSPARSRPIASTTRRSGLYHFLWATYCDWYVELAKPLLLGEDAAAQAETRATAAWALAQALHLLHPIAPFVTEELWQQLFDRPGGMLIGAAWPRLGGELVDAAGRGRARLAGPPDRRHPHRPQRAERPARRPAHPAPAGRRRPRLATGWSATATRSSGWHASARSSATTQPIPPQSLVVVIDEATFALPVGDVIDLAAERARLEREIGKLDDRDRPRPAEAGQCRLRGARPGRGDRAAARAAERGRGHARAPAPGPAPHRLTHSDERTAHAPLLRPRGRPGQDRSCRARRGLRRLAGRGRTAGARLARRHRLQGQAGCRLPAARRPAPFSSQPTPPSPGTRLLSSQPCPPATGGSTIRPGSCRRPTPPWAGRWPPTASPATAATTPSGRASCCPRGRGSRGRCTSPRRPGRRATWSTRPPTISGRPSWPRPWSRSPRASGPSARSPSATTCSRPTIPPSTPSAAPATARRA